MSESSALMLKGRCVECLPKANLRVESLILNFKKIRTRQKFALCLVLLFVTNCNLPALLFHSRKIIILLPMLFLICVISQLFPRHQLSVFQAFPEYLVNIGGIGTSSELLVKFAPPVSGLKKGKSTQKVICFFQHITLKY